MGSAVTVLSSDDPIRVFQRFSTIDAISHGRAEVILGRGSFIESFPLFGFDLAQYEELFEEKLELYARVRSQQPVTWSGLFRTPLHDQAVFPPVENGLLPTWIGVGGSSASVVRAARYGFRLMLAIVGGVPGRLQPYVDLFHRSLDEFGQPYQPVGVHSIGHIADTDEQAVEEYWPQYFVMATRVGAERGFRQITRESFDRDVATGALYIGSPETVAQKIGHTVRVLDVSRFDLKYGNGGIAHDKLLHTIALYATAVIPRVRELLASD